MASLTGTITNPDTQEVTTVTLELDDLKAWTWVTGHIAANGYDQKGLTFNEQCTLVLADAGRLFKNTAQQYELQQIRQQARAERQAKLQEPVWNSGITLPAN